MKDIIRFFGDITHLRPNKNQKEFLAQAIEPENGWILLSCGRGTGKTLSIAVLVSWFIFEYAQEKRFPLRILIVTPQSRMLWNYITRFISENKEFRSKILEGMKGTYETIPLLRFKLKDSSEVKITKRATDLEVRGFQGQIVIIDEAALVKDKIIAAALGCVTGPMTKRILLSTPSHEGEFIKKVKYHKRKGWRLYNWSELDCPWISKEDIKKKKKNMNRDLFRAEVLGKVPRKAKNLYYYVLGRCLSINPPIKEIGPVYAALDLAFGKRNACALLIIQRLSSNCWKVLYAKKWPGKKLREILGEIQKALDFYGVEKLKIDQLPKELAKSAYSSLKVREKELFSSHHRKESMAMHLMRIMAKGKVEISQDHKDLIKELKLFYLGQAFKHDLTDCLMIALYNEKDETSQGIVVINSKKRKKPLII